MNTANPGRKLVGAVEQVASFRHPIVPSGHGIVGDPAQVGRVRLNQLIERCGCRLFVGGVFLDGMIDFVEVLAKRRFPCANNRLLVVSRPQGDQDEKNGHDGHQLEQSKTKLDGRGVCGAAFRLVVRSHRFACYHSEYLVPSRAVPGAWL